MLSQIKKNLIWSRLSLPALLADPGTPQNILDILT
jgi:hypothetical protein